MSDTATTATLDRQINGQPFPAVGTYDVDQSHSTIQATAKHLMVSKVRGTFTGFEGTLTVAEDPKDSSAEITIDAATVDTRDPKRDEHLRSPDFLDVERFPKLTFRTTRIESGWKVVGDLTIRDTTREVVLDTEYLGTFKNPFGQTVAAFSATTKINREEFGMTWNAPLETGGVLVSKDLAIEIELQAALQQ